MPNSPTAAPLPESTPDQGNTPGPSGPSGPVLPDLDITMDTTPNAPGGAIRLRLPALVIGHVITLLLAGGGTYQLTKSDTTATQTELQRLEGRMERMESNHAQLNERLARIETNTSNTKEAVQELRQWLRNTKQQ